MSFTASRCRNHQRAATSRIPDSSGRTAPPVRYEESQCTISSAGKRVPYQVSLGAVAAADAQKLQLLRSLHAFRHYLHAALALAAALDCRVEDLFQLGSRPPARQPGHGSPNASLAGTGGPRFPAANPIYPSSQPTWALVGHDGVYQEGQFREQLVAAPSDTLVIASCDPAIGRWPMISFAAAVFACSPSHVQPASADAFWHGAVHVAGIHLAAVGHREQNAAAAREKLRGNFHLLRGAAGRRAWPWPRACNSRAFTRQCSRGPAGWGEKPARQPASCLTNCCRIVALPAASPMDIEAWRRPCAAVGRTWESACGW